MENNHPTDEELRRLVQFHLPLDQAQRVTEHLRICQRCKARCQEISAAQPALPVPEVIR